MRLARKLGNENPTVRHHWRNPVWVTFYCLLLENDTMIIEYTSSVFTQAGWRSVTITANADKISAGMAQVVKVTEIDGDAPTGYTSRTGAKRQTYNAAGIAAREIGAKKRISTCRVMVPT